MEKVTFLESIVKILKMISSVPFLIEILILTLILLIVMIFFYFVKSKKGKITTLIIYFVTLALLPISHISFFVNSLDKIIENTVKIIYFPSWYIYLIMLIITDVSVLKELIKAIKEEKTKWINAINFAYFFIFQFLFFLIVRIVSTNNIDIFNTSELYSNSLLLSIIQISSYLFWIRMGIKILVLIINKLSSFEFKGKKEEIETIDNEINNMEYNIDSNKSMFDSSNLNFESINVINNEISNNDMSTIKQVDTVIDNSVTDIESLTSKDILDNIPTNKQKEEKIELLDFDLDKNQDNDNYFDDFYG